jgi:MFS family permease
VTRASANDNAETTQEKSEGEGEEIEDKEEVIVKNTTENKTVFKPVYAFFVLFVTLLCRILVQWGRKTINYAYSYTGLGEAAGSSFYEISAAYPQLQGWYGLLTGVIYTIPYSLFGLVVGKFSDNANRKLWLGISVILASLTMGVSGFVNSFALLGAMRIFHGMANSATNPLSFSLVADYFPPDKRSTANSIIQAGNYIGVGVSSLSILLIS